jgi:hypothetical protein
MPGGVQILQGCSQLGAGHPDYPNGQVARAATIHQLITHTSGMGDWSESERFPDLRDQICDFMDIYLDRGYTVVVLSNSDGDCLAAGEAIEAALSPIVSYMPTPERCNGDRRPPSGSTWSSSRRIHWPKGTGLPFALRRPAARVAEGAQRRASLSTASPRARSSSTGCSPMCPLCCRCWPPHQRERGFRFAPFHTALVGTTPVGAAPAIQDIAVLENEDAVHVVGHDDPGIQRHVWVLPVQPYPRLGCDLSPFVQLHLVVHYLAQQALPVLHADGDEIGPGRGVIVTRQTDRTAMVFVAVVRRIGFLLVMVAKDPGAVRATAPTGW